MPIHRFALRAAAGLLAALLASPANCAETLTIRSDPNDMARQALGGRKGAAAAGVWRDGAAVYGMAAHGVKADPATLFEIGSISKLFTGILLAQSVERGDFALDDKLGKLLQGEAAFSPEVAAITLRQLTVHTACLPYLPELPAGVDKAPMANPFRSFSRADLWASLAALKLTQPPPCETAYSNVGYAVLGELLARRYGKPWETLVHENITGPLGMRDTVQHLGAKAGRLAPAFAGNEPTPPWDFVAYAGAGALRSSPADMLVFGRAILAGKKGPLGAAAVRILQPLGTFYGTDIGYAMTMRGPPGKRTYVLSGGTGGFRSEMVMMPDLQQVLVVMASNGEAPTSVVPAAILGQRYPLASGRITVDPASLPDYQGVFRVSSVNAFSFVAEGGVLRARVPGQRFAPLTAVAPDVFTLPALFAEFHFLREQGKVTGAIMRQHGTEVTARRTAEPLPARVSDSTLTQEAIGGSYIVPAAIAPFPMTFEVRADDGQIAIRFNEQPLLPVFAMDGRPDRFTGEVVAAEFQFERDGRGRIVALVLYQHGQSMRAERQALAANPSGSAAK